MLERFTDRARRVMQLANQEAQRMNHEYVGTEHVLIGLIKQGDGVAANVLVNLGLDLATARREVEQLVSAGPEGVIMGKLPPTPRTKAVLQYACEEAKALGHGLARDHECTVARIFAARGLTDKVRETVLEFLGCRKESPARKDNPVISQAVICITLFERGMHIQSHGNGDAEQVADGAVRLIQTMAETLPQYRMAAQT